jgi:hypothetical protein
VNSAFGEYWVFCGPVENRIQCRLDPKKYRQKGLGLAENTFTGTAYYFFSKPQVSPRDPVLPFSGGIVIPGAVSVHQEAMLCNDSSERRSIWWY